MDTSSLVVDSTGMREAITAGLHDGLEFPACDYYFAAFAKKAETLANEGNVGLSAAFRMLGAITSLRLNPDDANRPFEAFLARESSRTPILDDLSDEQIQVVSEVTAEIVDAELRARMADVVWVRRRDHRLARTAASAYMASGARLLPTILRHEGVNRFERALQIAAMLGTNQALFDECLGIVEDTCSREGEENFTAAVCLDLLLKFRSRNPERLAEIAKHRADSDTVKAVELWRRRFLELAARFFERAKRLDDARDARVEVARSFEREADIALKSEATPSVFVAMTFFENSIQAFRRISGTEADRERVHRRILDLGKQAVHELPTLASEPIDLSRVAQAAKDSVRGKPIDEALRRLALYDRIPDKARLRADAEEMTKNYPLAFMFPATTLSGSGKVVAKQGAMSSQSEDDKNSVILREMFRNGSLERALIVRGQVEPMRQQILSDHCVRYHAFEPLVFYNPLVPPGREHLYILGLHAGLHGDLVQSLHILIPQFENSVRHVLSQHGVITSGINADGIQTEHDLNVLLYESKFEDVFSPNIAFDLQCLLVERAGANFRNQLAHGMLEHGAFFGDTALYIWWLILRLCCLGASQAATDSTPETSTSGGP